MRISDWSSDVCSSDLIAQGRVGSVAMKPASASRLAMQAACQRWMPSRLKGLGYGVGLCAACVLPDSRSEVHKPDLQSLMRISNAVLCLKQNTHSPTMPRVYAQHDNTGYTTKIRKKPHHTP